MSKNFLEIILLFLFLLIFITGLVLFIAPLVLIFMFFLNVDFLFALWIGIFYVPFSVVFYGRAYDKWLDFVYGLFTIKNIGEN